MKKVLNFIVFGIGTIHILIGLLKLVNLIQSVELMVAGMTIKLNPMKGLFYIIVVNLIGGLAMIHHSLSTLEFNKKILEKKDVINKPLSKAVLYSGVIVLIISFWLVLENIILLSGFENRISQFWPLFVVCILLFLPFAIIPFILISKNFSLNSSINEKINNKRKAEQIVKLQGQKRRQIRKR
tara:strand:- start:437 stop:985 length:549 start_codon:yes stop_codon:yes gene_type:complete